MAGGQNRDSIVPIRARDGPDGAWAPDGGGQLGVGPGAPSGDLAERAPHEPLERRPRLVEGNVEHAALPAEVLVQLRSQSRDDRSLPWGKDAPERAGESRELRPQHSPVGELQQDEMVAGGRGHHAAEGGVDLIHCNGGQIEDVARGPGTQPLGDDGGPRGCCRRLERPAPLAGTVSGRDRSLDRAKELDVLRIGAGGTRGPAEDAGRPHSREKHPVVRAIPVEKGAHPLGAPGKLDSDHAGNLGARGAESHPKTARLVTGFPFPPSVTDGPGVRPPGMPRPPTVRRPGCSEPTQLFTRGLMRAGIAAVLLLAAASGVADAQVTNRELGYTLTVPAGFVAHPAGKTNADIVDCWGEEAPSDAGPITLCVERLRGTLGREPMTAEQLGSPNLLLTSFRWNEFDIEGVEAVATPDNGFTSTFVAQIPLEKEAIQLIVRGPGSHRARVRAAMTTTLVSLVGETGWLSRLQSFERYGRLAGKIVGGILAVLAGVWLRSRRRRRAELATA